MNKICDCRACYLLLLVKLTACHNFLGEVVELSQVEGVIHARSTVHIKVTVRPCHSERHCCTIKYSILSQVKGIFKFALTM